MLKRSVSVVWVCASGSFAHAEMQTVAQKQFGALILLLTSNMHITHREGVRNPGSFSVLPVLATVGHARDRNLNDSFVSCAASGCCSMYHV